MAGLEDAPIVARVVRNGFVESIHRGIGVVTGPDGGVLVAVGDVNVPVLPRSSNKPFQALGMLEAGARLSDEWLAIACASHSGEEFHLEAVRGLLGSVGLDESALRNTPDWPLDEPARRAWIESGRGPSSLAQNCSGKHAGMLAACAANGWPIGTYLDPDHPVQRAITATIGGLIGQPAPVVAVDGCGAPLHAMPLAALARGFGRLASAASGAERQVAEAMRRHPEYVGGAGRDVTRLMRDAPGLVAKDGAEAVYAVGLPDGRGVAVKVADGSSRARTVLLAALLRRAGGVPDAALEPLLDVPVLGHGRPVGAVVVAGELSG